MSRLKYLLPISALIGMTTAANADVLFTAFNRDAAIFTGAPTLVDLNGPAAGGTEVNFTTASPGKVVVTFFAECSIAGDFQSWVNIDILVDPAGAAPQFAIAPTDSDNAMCAGGSDAQDNWVSAAVAGSVTLPQGTHKLKVRVSRGFTSGAGSNNIRLDDTFLLVQR